MNLVFHEYADLLDRECAPLYGVQYGRYNHTLTITSSDGDSARTDVSIRLELARDDGGVTCLTPRVQVGSSATLPADPAVALARLAAAKHTIEQAVALWSRIAHVRVYTKDPPCTACGGRGTDRGGSCSWCEGRGYRIVESDSGDEE